MRLSSAWAVFTLLIGTSVAESNITTQKSSQQILQADFKPAQVFENTNLVRNINLDKGYVRETINVQVTNIDKQPQQDYYVPFEYDIIGKVGGFEARDKKNGNLPPFTVTIASLSAVTGEDGTSSKPTQYYVIHFIAPLAPKAQITLSMSYHILGALSPLPATIQQADKQYLAYTFSAYWPSAYATLKQKTKVKAPSADIPEYTITEGLTKGKDPEIQGTSVTYGSYDSKAPAGATYPVTVRYEFTKPVLVASVLERDIEVSHWGGNLATEERYWLRNDGAQLANQFSRVLWTTQNFYHQSASSALKELKIPLKPGSVDAYYTDDIGNVTTSRYRPNNIREVSWELKPRYPLFGGWKYSFRIGWNNALKSAVRRLKTTSDSYILSVPFLEGPKMPEGIQYERFEIRVILPEGSKITKWEVQGGTNVPQLQEALSLHKTFMDTLGRTTLTLSAVNVIDELRDVQLFVTYELPFSATLRKPLSIFVGFTAVFGVLWVLSLIDTSIGRKK